MIINAGPDRRNILLAGTTLAPALTAILWKAST